MQSTKIIIPHSLLAFEGLEIYAQHRPFSARLDDLV